MVPDVVHLSAVGQRALLEARSISAVELCEAHLEQIERVDPLVNALVTRTAELALARAGESDDRRSRGEPARLLEGIPVAHKDLLDTAGVRTTYGSPIYADNFPAFDALPVRRMREAGAVMLGKTNTPEFGAGSQTFNPVFGTTRNPWDPSRTCGGSSGGSAVALACGMVALADGSDLGGSLRNPAAFCGVVGLRPSPGRVPSWPSDAPYSPFAVDGPMARTVADVALLLDALTGEDPRVPLSLPAPAVPFRQIDEREPPTVRIAFAPSLGGLPIDPAVSAGIAAALRALATSGMRVELDAPDLADADHIFEVERALGFTGLRGDLEAHPELVKETVRWNIEQGLALTGADISDARFRHARLCERVDAFMQGYDVLACPATQVMPFPVEIEYPEVIDGVRLTTYIEWIRVCSRITATGLPAISIPAGFSSDGLPIGLQLVGRRRGERGLLAVAQAAERVLGAAARPPIAS